MCFCKTIFSKNPLIFFKNSAKPLASFSKAHIALIRVEKPRHRCDQKKAFARVISPGRGRAYPSFHRQVRPFAGPEAVLAYLSRYTHRVAISNSRLVALDERGVTFHWKDYRAKGNTRYKTMTLGADEFMRRFLLHVLPGGLHRIRHYELIANAGRKSNLAKIRELLEAAPAADTQSNGAAVPTTTATPTFVCQHSGAPMIIIDTLVRGQSIRRFY